MDTSLEMLRHAVATVAYRANKAMRGAPPEFAECRCTPDSPTPAHIVAHLHDLFAWGMCLYEGRSEWRVSEPLPWQEGVDRFYAVLQRFDEKLAAGAPPGYPLERILQGPVADALTHVGQIAMLRRLAGCKIPGENYSVAEIRMGVVGQDQAAPVREF